MFKVYKPEYNPQDLSGQVGGTITSNLFSGYLNELFYHVSVPPSGVDEVAYQYRKLFIKNEHTTSSTNTRIWLDSLEHPSQISICRSSGLSDYTSSATGEPSGVTGWVSPTNYAEGLSLGTMTSSAYSGVWIRQALSGIEEPDPYSSFRIYIGGIIT
ncbi:MAG: hypothetical protein KDH96_13145 [Candidatus Riesia sp.]|nr:hypothetical protein [Candidatus Riesia sp.]